MNDLETYIGIDVMDFSFLSGYRPVFTRFITMCNVKTDRFPIGIYTFTHFDSSAECITNNFCGHIVETFLLLVLLLFRSIIYI